MGDPGRYFEFLLFAFGVALEKKSYSKFFIGLLRINGRSLFMLDITQEYVGINIFFVERTWFI